MAVGAVGYELNRKSFINTRLSSSTSEQVSVRSNQFIHYLVISSFRGKGNRHLRKSSAYKALRKIFHPPESTLLRSAAEPLLPGFPKGPSLRNACERDSLNVRTNLARIFHFGEVAATSHYTIPGR